MSENITSELHLIILWEYARPKESEILADIAKHLKILECKEIIWTKEKVSNNFTRFYGVKLDSGSEKETHCGVGAFLLVLAKDENPVYDFMQTSKGIESVNRNVFSLKTKYRSWTGGGHRVHSTNSVLETNHDIVLLLGCNYEDYLKKAPKEWDGKIEKLHRDITGCNGWQSLNEFFYTLNATAEYVVMRNYDILPDAFRSELHGDIDILAKDYQEICYLANAHPMFSETYRVHNYVMIDNQKVLFDFRFIGDDYYCRGFERDMLKFRVKNERDIYIPNAEYAFYSLVYHAIYQKPQIAEDYYDKALLLFKELELDKKYDLRIYDNPFMLYHELLKAFMLKNEYTYPRPKDLSVCFMPEYTEQVKFFLEKQSRTNTQLTLPDIAEIKKDERGYYIGKVYIDISHFTGETGDGDIEDELLLAARKGKLQELLEADNRWPVFYHVSHERENLLDFLPANKKARALEIGSGCGGVTGILAEKFGFLETVEISERRANITAYRHSDKDNITIHVGNLNDMTFEHKFDIITLIGVLEYAPSFTHSQNPFEDFLTLVGSLLAEDGVLIIAIENRLGMKYFSGANEDHLGRRFVGVAGYKGIGNVKTFSKKELGDLMNKVGFQGLEWYYPYPDYKIPASIYSDRQLPSAEEITNSANHSWDQDRYEFFSENEALASTLSAGLFGEFANSFLFFARKNEIKTDMPSAVHHSFGRTADYRLVTEFYADLNGKKRIIKTARTLEQKKHLKAIERNYKILSKIYGKEHIAWARLISSRELEIEYIEGESLGEKLKNAVVAGDNDKFNELLKFYAQNILKGSEEETLLPADLSPYAPNRQYDIDMGFWHIIFTKDGYKIFDYEWLYPKVSRNYILWRTLAGFYGQCKELAVIEPNPLNFYLKFGFSQGQIMSYMREEQRFQAEMSETYEYKYIKQKIKTQ